nr:hypothetical protein [Dorea formicigenerans]
MEDRLLISEERIHLTSRGENKKHAQTGKRQCKLGWNFHVVKTGDSFDIGNGKQFVFVEMRMLHWPDSMATYLTGDNQFLRER